MHYVMPQQYMHPWVAYMADASLEHSGLLSVVRGVVGMHTCVIVAMPIFYAAQFNPTRIESTDGAANLCRDRAFAY